MVAAIHRADSIKARRADSLRAVRDSIRRRVKDSLQRVAFVKDSLRVIDLNNFSKKVDSHIYKNNPFTGFKDPVRIIAIERKQKGKDALFYCILGVLLFFAFSKNAFPRYLSDLFKLFFRTSLKQKQLREQLIHAPLPSLLFNISFLLSGSLFINLLFQHFKLGTGYSFWKLFGYCLAGLVVIYSLKFISLKLLGWILRMSDAINIYIFIIFSANKVLAIILLPFIVSLAFMDNVFYQTGFALSMTMLGLFFLYRI
jgi:hypothetical protein